MTDNYMKIHPDDWRQLLEDIEVITIERDQALAWRDQLLKQRFVVDEVEENARRRVENAFRSERDEARREVCYAECVVGAASGERYTPQGIAEIKGWDCFKNQETP